MQGEQGYLFLYLFIGLAVVLMLFAPNAGAQLTSSDGKAVAAKESPDIYETLYIPRVTSQDEINDIVTDLRSMLSRAKLYYVGSQGAVSFRGSSEDLQLAKKIIAEVAHPKKAYRLTYTITEKENGNRIGVEHVSLVMVYGRKSYLKQGNRLPIITGTTEAANNANNTQVQYVDLGLNIEATLEGSTEDLKLSTKVEQTSVAEEKSNVSIQDPIIRQTTFTGHASLLPGKPVVLGSLDLPGSAHHKEIEVVAEPLS